MNETMQLLPLHDAYHDTWSVEEAGGDTVAHLWYLDETSHDRIPFDENESERYATLFAASPKLLMALEAILKHAVTGCGTTESTPSGDVTTIEIDSAEWDKHCDTIFAARAVIAEAKGMP
jgi:hypothetical protein